jgi:hypothetical protein
MPSGEGEMRKLICAATMMVAGAFAALPAHAANICISTRDIVSTQSQNDGKAITFKMRDGKVWRNDLHGACPDLRFDGFEWVVRNPDETVCENMQSFRVLRSGEICVLGKFTDITPVKKKDAN